MVSPTKERQVLSIVERRGSQDLNLDDLPEAPIKSAHNRRSGVSSATYRDGRTETYRPAPKGCPSNPVSGQWVKP